MNGLFLHCISELHKVEGIHLYKKRHLLPPIPSRAQVMLHMLYIWVSEHNIENSCRKFGVSLSLTPNRKQTMTELSTDYLIIGAGALGMGFLDEIIRNSEDIEAIIVDIRDKPGGHW